MTATSDFLKLKAALAEWLQGRAEIDQATYAAPVDTDEVLITTMQTADGESVSVALAFDRPL